MRRAITKWPSSCTKISTPRTNRKARMVKRLIVPQWPPGRRRHGPGRRSRGLAPGQQPVDRLNARQIVVDHRDHEHQQEDEAAEQELLLDLHAEIAAREAF